MLTFSTIGGQFYHTLCRRLDRYTVTAAPLGFHTAHVVTVA